MSDRAHWEHIYRTHEPTALSWYQADPRTSLALIEAAAPDRSSGIIDVGGGASVLVDRLVGMGYTDVTVLDHSRAALDHSRRRMGSLASRVQWLEADVLDFAAGRQFDVWHDRAVFHFLTNAADRARYVHQLGTVVRRGGHVVIGTFADDGPTKCSGLEVVRYGPEALAAELGEGFELLETRREEHFTPGGRGQSFVYCRFRVRGAMARGSM